MCNFDMKHEAIEYVEKAIDNAFAIKGLKAKDKIAILNGLHTALARLNRIHGVGENGDFNLRYE